MKIVLVTLLSEERLLPNPDALVASAKAYCSESLLQQNHLVLNRGYQLMQVVLCNGGLTLVVVALEDVCRVQASDRNWA